MTTPLAAAEQILEQALADLDNSVTQGEKSSQRRHSSANELVLSLGRWFVPPTTGDPAPGAQGLCYAAAARLARSRARELTYVEGYVLLAVQTPRCRSRTHGVSLRQGK